MGRKTHDLAVKIESYTDREGKQRNKYQNVGAVIEGNNGSYILLDRYFNPAGLPNPENRTNVIISMFDARQEGARQEGHRTADEATAREEFPDNIPF